MVSTTTGNGQARRRQLADEIDRLNGVLDGLSEALNESVADAVKAAVGGAARGGVEAPMRELRSTPEFLRAFLPPHEPPAPPAPRAPEARLLRMKEALSAALAGLWPRARQAACAARQAPRAAWTWSMRK